MIPALTPSEVQSLIAKGVINPANPATTCPAGRAKKTPQQIRDWYEKRKARFFAMGLTANGAPRVRPLRTA